MTVKEIDSAKSQSWESYFKTIESGRLNELGRTSEESRQSISDSIIDCPRGKRPNMRQDYSRNQGKFSN